MRTCIILKMVPGILVHFTAGGAEVLTEISVEGTYYLPDVHDDDIELSPELDEEHSALCLGLP